MKIGQKTYRDSGASAFLGLIMLLLLFARCDDIPASYLVFSASLSSIDFGNAQIANCTDTELILENLSGKVVKSVGSRLSSSAFSVGTWFNKAPSLSIRHLSLETAIISNCMFIFAH